jgi:hypothetical protein
VSFEKTDEVMLLINRGRCAANTGTAPARLRIPRRVI